MKISQRVEKLESLIDRKAGHWLSKATKKLKQYWLYILVGSYFYGMLINSIQRGIEKTFPKDGQDAITSIWVINPIENLAAIFTPTGFGVTFFCILMIILITKKGFNWFSGYKFKRDPRGFDILPDGTHGTSGWMDKKDLVKIMDTGSPNELSGTVLGKIKEDSGDDNSFAEYLSLKEKCGLNDHIMVYGATGTGKSWGFVRPFVLQTARRKESIVILDPKGELFENLSNYLREQGYIVKAYNLLDMENSDGFNCISDIENDKTLVQSVAAVIINNTSNANEKSDFWSKAEMNLLMALLHYIVDKRDAYGKLLPIEERSLGRIYEILSTKTFGEIEEIFDGLPKGHPALAPYGIFRLANRQILGNIAIGLGNRLAVFQNNLVDIITRHNDIDLELPGQKPCAYFCIISAQDSTLEFLSSMFFSLLFSRLGNFARRNGINGRLPMTVNICLDEFCNCGTILDFKKIISVVRSQGINCQIIIQGVAQLSDRYEHNQWEEIISACDTQIFLGCNDEMTAEYISKKCGKITIRTSTSNMPMQPLFSPIYNSTRPGSIGKQNTQRDLMLPDELRTLDNKKSIVLVRGQKPIKLYKISPMEMPDFSELHNVKITDYNPSWRKNMTEIISDETAHFDVETKSNQSTMERANTLDISSLEPPPARKVHYDYEVLEPLKTPDISASVKSAVKLERYEQISPDDIINPKR